MGNIYDDFPEDAVLLVVKAVVHPTEERIFEAWYDARTRDWPEPSEHGRGWWMPPAYLAQTEVEIGEFRTYTVFDSREAAHAFVTGDAMTAFRCAFLLAYPHGRLEIEVELTRSRIQTWNFPLAIPPGDPPRGGGRVTPA